MSRPHFLAPALTASGRLGPAHRAVGATGWPPTPRSPGSSSSRTPGCSVGIAGRRVTPWSSPRPRACTPSGCAFRIDVVGVASRRHGRRPPPRRAPAPGGVLLAAFAIVELAAGATDQAGLESGDRLLTIVRTRYRSPDDNCPARAASCWPRISGCATLETADSCAKKRANCAEIHYSFGWPDYRHGSCCRMRQSAVGTPSLRLMS